MNTYRAHLGIPMALLVVVSGFFLGGACGRDFEKDRAGDRSAPRGSKILKITIRLPGDEFAGEEDLELRRRIEASIKERGIGAVLQQGSGMGMMEITVKVEDSAAARMRLKSLLRELAPGARYSLAPVPSALP